MPLPYNLQINCFGIRLSTDHCPLSTAANGRLPLRLPCIYALLASSLGPRPRALVPNRPLIVELYFSITDLFITQPRMQESEGRGISAKSGEPASSLKNSDISAVYL